MAKGGFVVNVDGLQRRCHALKVDYGENALYINNEEIGMAVEKWSTFSVHAITKDEAEDIVYDRVHEATKDEEVKDA